MGSWYDKLCCNTHGYKVGGISINNPSAWTAFQGGSLDDEYDVLQTLDCVRLIFSWCVYFAFIFIILECVCFSSFCVFLLIFPIAPTRLHICPVFHRLGLAHRGEDVPRPEAHPDWRKIAIKVSVCGDGRGEIFETPRGGGQIALQFDISVWMLCPQEKKALDKCLVLVCTTVVLALIFFFF